jgi:hypothetical protein
MSDQQMPCPLDSEPKDSEPIDPDPADPDQNDSRLMDPDPEDPKDPAPLLGPRCPERYLATGQEQPYDEAGRVIARSGACLQDGAVAWGRSWPTPRFTLPEGGAMALDELTGLWWSRDASGGGWPITWREAFEAVNRLNRQRLGGHQDWRLPNRRELRSLVSHAHREPALPDRHPFEGVFPGPYFTSSSVAGKPTHAWTVRLDGGRMFFSHKQESCWVWPVRGEAVALPATGQRGCWDAHGRRSAGGRDAEGHDGALRCGLPWPAPRFRLFRVLEGHHRVVVDRLTGLGWCPFTALPTQPVTWTEALSAACRLGRRRYAGRGDWRLPTVNELESLVDAEQWAPALPKEHPLGEVPPSCWSSTTSGYEPNWAMALYLEGGAVGVGHKAGAHHHGWAVCGRGP